MQEVISICCQWGNKLTMHVMKETQVGPSQTSVMWRSSCFLSFSNPLELVFGWQCTRLHWDGFGSVSEGATITIASHSKLAMLNKKTNMHNSDDFSGKLNIKAFSSNLERCHSNYHRCHTHFWMWKFANRIPTSSPKATLLCRDSWKCSRLYWG